MNIYKKLALFAGGTLFGSAGIKLLSSKDAKNAYAHTAAAVLRMKDCVMTTVNTVQENAADVLATAKDINEQRAQQAEQPADGAKFPGGEIVRNIEADRLQILFDEKPDEETRAALKQNGFRWSPRYSAWQRQLTPNAEAAARRALGLTE